MDWEKTYIFTSSPILCDKSMQQGSRDPQAQESLLPASPLETFCGRSYLELNLAGPYTRQRRGSADILAFVMVIYHVSGSGGHLARSGKFFWDFFVLCGRVRTNTHTFGDPPQNPDKIAPNWQIFVRTKLATCLANITLYNPGSSCDSFATCEIIRRLD